MKVKAAVFMGPHKPFEVAIYERFYQQDLHQ